MSRATSSPICSSRPKARLSLLTVWSKMGTHCFHTTQVMKENKDGYKAEVQKAQRAGEPIIVVMQKDVAEAVAAYEAAQAAQESEVVSEAQSIVTTPVPEPVAA